MLEKSGGDREKTGKLVARSFYKILRTNGFTHPEILEVTGNMMDEVMKDIRANGKDRENPLELRPSDNWPHTKVVA
jgi:pyruvate-formate lyase-activating enzyme